jgi:hypothetical protein
MWHHAAVPGLSSSLPVLFAEGAGAQHKPRIEIL